METSSEKQKLIDEMRQLVDKFARAEANRMAIIMLRFAQLLLLISDDAERIAKQNLDMQRTIIRLSWGLLWLTFVLYFVALIQLIIMFK